MNDLISHYQLLPHPEGGFYRETYRAREVIPRDGLPKRFPGSRSISTAIYYLLRQGERSRWHRIQSDEVWHFYAGDPLVILEILPDGSARETVLGADFSRGQVAQHVVPAGAWFGAIPAKDSRYSFCGCTVAPGFDFADFELAEIPRLTGDFPAHRALIERLA